LPKYGRGMKVEVVEAIRRGKLKQPLTTKDVREYMHSNGWYPSENFVNVFLSNHSNPEHSKSYQKIFESMGNGKYFLKEGIS